MSDTVIRVENLSKQYRLGVVNHGQLAKDLQSWWARLRGREDPNMRIGASDLRGPAGGEDRFWALRDISFEVKRGERLGIIGRNGAGKSTLLKILSRVTAPTEGLIKVKGRVASLLEVGTGFHPELTGRENVFLNGVILGMTKREVAKKFDEIVDFAGIEKFIDTPVKRYSSGMYVRLAFAVAAHLEPDILVIDEVLAVGDVSFQKKCIGKMEDVSKNEGRTVLFVSHNMSAISSLCETAIMLSNGSIQEIGPTSDVVMNYYDVANSALCSSVDYSARTYIGDELCQLIGASIQNRNGEIIKEAQLHEPIRIVMVYRIAATEDAKFVPNFHFLTADGTYAFVDNAPNIRAMNPGLYEAVCEVPAFLMNEGMYSIGVAVTAYFKTSHKVCFFEKSALLINIYDSHDENSNRYGYGGRIMGVVRPRLNWTIRGKVS